MFIFLNTFDAVALNPMTSFVDPIACEIVQKIRATSIFTTVHPCLSEVQKTIRPKPVTCEYCKCHSPIIRSVPMEFYGKPTDCCETIYDEEANEAKEAENAFDAYIDEVLDQDYDY